MKQTISLTQAYIISFFLLAMWGVCAYLTMFSQIKAQEQYAELINISGKQRMLSQRTALLANYYLETGERDFLEKLQHHHHLMQADHQYLVANLPSQELKDLYFAEPSALDSKSRDYFLLLERFERDSESYSIELIYQRTSQLLPLLDHAVKVYQEESDRKTARLMRLEGYILGGTLLTLLLEALFILRPALRRANWNMSQLQRMVAEQTRQLAIYQRIFANADDGIMITDAENRIIEVNPAFSRITGYEAAEVIGEKPSILKSSHQDAAFYAAFWHDLFQHSHWTGEFINRKKDGSVYYQLTYAFLLYDAARNVDYHVGIMSDVSGIKEDKNRLEHLALYDMLTRLPNRSYLMTQMQKALERARRHRHRLAVILLDLDNFKSINDNLTHRVGDLVLKNTGQLLQQCVRSTDTVARLGGDEFVLLAEEVPDEDRLICILEKIQACLDEPMTVDDYQLQVTCSMGVALYPDDAQTRDSLLQFADTSMYHAKRLGKNQFSFFTSELNAAVQEKIKIENGLKQAIGKDEFHLMFQPVVKLKDRKIVACEVLLGWRNAALGTVPPEKFIPVAEGLGLIRMIDNWVLQKVRSLLKAGVFRDCLLSVNISAKRFSHNDFLREVEQIFAGFEVDGRIVLELTETAIIEDINHTRDVLEALKQQGFRIAIDDFGTGYSSLYHLKHLPIDFVKIDKSFVMDMLSDDSARIIVDSIISMAQRMDLTAVAEGIETEEQFAYLLENGQNLLGQGYYFSYPRRLEDIEALLTDRRD